MASGIRLRWFVFAACILAAVVLYAARRGSSPDPALSTAGRPGVEAPGARSADGSSGASDRSGDGRSAPIGGTVAYRFEGALSDEEVLELAAQLEELARTDPEFALGLAQQGGDTPYRETFLKAVLTGWVQVDPDAAGLWVLDQALIDRGEAFSAMMEGVVDDAATAQRIAEAFFEKDPDREEDYGFRLVKTFREADEFAAAAGFAATTRGRYAADWLVETYEGWTMTEPRAAAESATRLPDANLRSKAVEAVIQRWAPRDPKALAEFALSMPEGSQRSQAFAEAMRAWMSDEPNDAQNWLAERESSTDLDSATQLVATHRKVAASHPDRAIDWARTIVDPVRRATALKAVVLQWAASDAGAARQFAETTTDFPPQTREKVLGELDKIVAKR
jgi:hypothetical protein